MTNYSMRYNHLLPLVLPCTASKICLVSSAESNSFEFTHLPHPSPPPCVPTSSFRGIPRAQPSPPIVHTHSVHPRDRHYYSLLRFNRESHIYPGAHPFPIMYCYPQQPAVTVVSTPGAK